MTSILVLWMACSGKDGGDTSTDTNGDSGADTNLDTGDTSETADTGDSSDTGVDSDSGGDSATPMPDDPRPLTITVSGAYTGVLTFDTPTCAWYDGVPNYRAFWRNGEKEHVFVLVAEIIGDYTGEGTYDETMGRVDVKLQEEAGGSGAYFGTDTTQGDTVSLTVEHVDEINSFGTFTFNRLHGVDGAVTITPQPLPIWCPEMN